MCSGSGSPTPCLWGALQGAIGSSQQFLEGAVKAALQVWVSNHQHALLIPRYQTDLLRNSCIQLRRHTNKIAISAGNKTWPYIKGKSLTISNCSIPHSPVCKSQSNSPKQAKEVHLIETRHDVAQVDPGCASFSHLVEQVISEELQQVTIPCLRPRRILLESATVQTAQHQRFWICALVKTTERQDFQFI